jgi:ubiquitin carboxyl-terminal hydrolase 25/28
LAAGVLASRLYADLSTGSLDGLGQIGLKTCQELRYLGPPSVGPNHDLLMIPSQSHSAGVGQLEIIAAPCLFCNFFFIFKISPSAKRICGTGSEGDNPLHHFVLRDHTRFEELNTEEYKYYPIIGRLVFHCSAVGCSCALTLEVLRPRLLHDTAFVRLLSGFERTTRQKEEVLATTPEAELRKYIERGPAFYLSRYVADLLKGPNANNPNGNWPWKILWKNKIFLLLFGPECNELFRYLEFELQMADDGPFCWVMPQLEDFPVTFSTDYRSRRAFFEAIKSELQWLRNSHDVETWDEMGDIHTEPIPAKDRIERALDCLNHGLTAKPKANDSVDDFARLGTMPDSNDRLLHFAYVCQKQTDHTNRELYFAALQRLAASRGEDLQTKVAIEESARDAPPKQSNHPSADPYKYFNLNPNFTAEAIIQVYRNFRTQSPKGKAEHRKALLRIGEDQNNRLIIREALSDTMDFEEALKYLEVEGEWPSDFIAQYAQSQTRVS